jgi:hypothetical protein
MEFFKIIELELLVGLLALTIFHSKLHYSINFMIADQITESNSRFVEVLVLSLLDLLILQV